MTFHPNKNMFLLGNMTFRLCSYLSYEVAQLLLKSNMSHVQNKSSISELRRNRKSHEKLQHKTRASIKGFFFL